MLYPFFVLFCQVPSDVDIRVMLTFLELYQTLLGFVSFKLYTDAGLVYPPPLDTKKDEGGAGVGAFSLQEIKRTIEAPALRKVKEVEVDGKRISASDVRQTIKSIAGQALGDNDVEMQNGIDNAIDEADEEFVTHPSQANPDEAAALPTLKTLSSLPQSKIPQLFSLYTFLLSRETSRPIFEFLVRSFGGRIGWPATSGSGSPFEEDDELITHVIIDRPLIVRENETEEERARRKRRKYVQPQWIVDCINAGKILLEEPYAQGKTLPPHLSPFEDRADAYDPTVGVSIDDAEMQDEEEEEEAGSESGEEDEEAAPEKAALKAAAAAEDAAALRAAELEAEAAGVDFGAFEKEARKARKKVRTAEEQPEDVAEEDMNKMMMSNKQRKLYERMKHGEKKRAVEVSIYCLLRAVPVANIYFAASKPRAEEDTPQEREKESDKVVVAEPNLFSFMVVFTAFRDIYCYTYIGLLVAKISFIDKHPVQNSPSDSSMILMASNISPIAIHAKLLAPNASSSMSAIRKATHALSIDISGSVPSSPDISNRTPSTRVVACSLSFDMRSFRLRGCEHFAMMVPMTVSSSVSMAPRS